MTKDNMQVVFKKDNIKKIMIERLSEIKIKIKEDHADIIVVELPNNEENEKNWTQTEVYVWLSGLNIEDEIENLIAKPYGEIKIEELCESMKKILSERENKHVFHDKKIIKGRRGNSISTSEYQLLIIVGLKEVISGYAELAEYIVGNIKEKLKNTDDFLNMSGTESGRRHLFDILQRKWILQGSFVEYYMKKNRLPDPEVLTQLSAARYEGSESEARIYFSDSAIDTIEKFTAAGNKDRIINKENRRMIRKLMEISKRNKVHLYAGTNVKKLDEDTEKVIHTISRLVQYREKQAEDTYVKFSGFMQWSLFEKKREVFRYCHGEYQLNVSEENYAYLGEIQKLKNVNKKMITELVAILREQKHGAAAVLFDNKTDAVDEADRLCNMKRGTRICSYIRYDEKTGWDKEQILGITGIDGALFIDCEGNCLAIGVIVDGKVVIKGNIGRGARYNSIANYIKLKPGCVGIIISEDVMVDIIQKQRK